MKKLSLLFTLISFCIFSQEKKFITPDLPKNQVYQYHISSASSLKSPKGKSYHAPFTVNQDVELTYLFNDGNDKIFSWKIMNYKHLHEGKKEEKNDCNCNKVAYRNQLTVYFRTDSLGAYKKINNLAQVRGNLLKNIAEQEKLLSKNDKNIFERVKRNPEGVISNIEEDIIVFSRYFGLENKNSVNTLFARRNNFPFGIKSKPFKVVLSVLSEEKDLKINVKNEFDKNKAEDDDYNIFRFNQDVEKEKKHYQLIADEEYVFSKENFRLLSAKLTAKEISNFHNDGIYDYQYSITQKE